MEDVLPNPSLVRLRSVGSLKAEPKLPTHSVTETEEYVEFDFRILTAGIISGHWFDFSESVLKQVVTKFKDARVILSHYPAIQNIIGVVTQTSFEPENENRPAGINGKYRIFKKFGSDIIEKLQTSPPLLDATSAGIRLDYERSHPKMSEFQHYMQLGEEVNGEIVRYIVKDILDVLEVSIVFRGADKFAKRLSESEEKDFDYYTKILNKKENSLKLTKEQIQAVNFTESDLKILGLSNDGCEIDQIQFDMIIGRLAVKEKEIATYQEAEKRNQKLIEFGVAYEESIRQEALKNYRAFALENQDENIISFLESGNLETVKTFSEDYKKRLQEKYPENGNKRQSSQDLDAESNTESESQKREIKQYKMESL